MCLAGKQRRWDIIQAHSSVACVLYHKDMDAFLVVSSCCFKFDCSFSASATNSGGLHHST
jgi:hypothetical protein